MSEVTDRINVVEIVEPADPGQADMPSMCQSGGCGGPAGPDPRIQEAPASFSPVIVNGAEIHPEAIAAEMQQHSAEDGETAWREAARALALRELLLQEARRLQVEAAPEEDEAGRRETEEDALIRALLEQTVNPAEVGEAECRRYYNGNRFRFRTPDLFEAAHILLEPEGDDEAAWTTAFEKARAMAEEVGDDPGAFAEAARRFSTCPTAQQSGSLGQVRHGELVEPVQAVLDRLAEGQTCREPVRSRFGVHVLRLHRKIDGRILPFDVVKPKIADMLEARAWTIAAANYAAALARASTVEGVLIDPDMVGAHADLG